MIDEPEEIAVDPKTLTSKHFKPKSKKLKTHKQNRRQIARGSHASNFLERESFDNSPRKDVDSIDGGID